MNGPHRLVEPMSQGEVDHLADILWWIKGYLAGADADSNSCPFERGHIEALRKARANLLPHVLPDEEMPF